MTDLAEDRVLEAAGKQVRNDEATLSNRRGRTLMAAFIAAHFSYHIGTGLLNPLLPFIRDAFALTYAQSGFLVTSFTMALGLSNVPIGVLADRIGSRPVLVAGLVMIGVLSAAAGLAGSYWQLMLIMLLMGLVAGSYHAPASSLVARAYPARVRGAAMGLHITGGNTSFFATPIAAAFLVGLTDSWRTPFVWLAFAPIVTGMLLWRLAPAAHTPPKASVERFGVFRELWSVVRQVGPLVSISILFQFFIASFNAFLTLYLVDARGLSGPVATALFGVPWFIGILASPLAGFFSDRLGRRAVILIGIAMTGPAWYALTIVPTELLVLPLIVIGFSGSTRQTVTEIFVTDSAPADRRATFLGGYYLLSSEVSSLGAPILGLAAGVFGIATAFSGATLFLICLSGLVLLARGRI
jgi:MFS family permease